MKNLITILIMAVLTGVFSVTSHAQTADTAKLSKLAADLSISKQKALQLYEAINYAVDVNGIMTDPKMTMAQNVAS